MSDIDATPPTPDGHRDRSTRLVVGGVLLCLAGAGALLLAVMMLGSTLYVRRVANVAETAQLGLGQAISGLLLYSGVGAALVTLGIGSFLRRRWSRPLVLVVAWGWLACAVFVGLVMTAVLPIMNRELASGPAPTVAIYGCLGALFGLFGILAPGALIGLYSGQDVRATLAARDPRERWTDRIPLPLLGLSVWLGFGAVSSLLTVFHPVLLFGSKILTGPVAILVFLVNGGIMGAVAVGLARRSRTAWWVGILTFVVWGVWSAVTVPRVDVDELMRATGGVQPPQAPDMLALFHDPRFLGGMILIWLVMVGYFLYARRYLEPRAGTP